MGKSFKCFIYMVLLFNVFFNIHLLAGQETNQWQHRLETALQSGNIEQIRLFFDTDFATQELESWKYQIKRGYLDFSSSTVIPITDEAILIHIPTDSSPYSGETFEQYFDFIYRIYRIKQAPKLSIPGQSTDFAITARCMDEFNPDFLTCTETLGLLPSENTMTVDSTITANVKANRLIFKLAKEFQLQSLTINGKKHPFQRFGYFITAAVETPNPVSFRVKGKIKAVSTHNQFFCIDDINFFLRSGGFAATPSPPPGTKGRPYFSSDEAEFIRVIQFPAQYKFLVYGDIIKDETANGKRTVTVRLTEKYLDGLSFYAQTDWNVNFIQRGGVKAGFYFPTSAKKEQEFLENEISSLLEWLNGIFKKDSDSKFSINFVVLNKFVKEGLLNDSKSIIASRASIIGSDGGGYIHELCHTAPQPHIDGNALWEKEGFTNYLSFNFLRDIKRNTDFWKRQKREYLHEFDLYCEPLAAITHKGIPCYWITYQKGPWIYRMLETELGRDNFDKAMTTFAKKEGEILPDTTEYFKIFEDVSGKDLTQFRKQWLERKQNPVLRARYTVTPSSKTKGNNTVTVFISQKKPVFYFPLDIELITKKETIRRTLLLDAPEKEISIPINSPLLSVQYDPDARMFALIKDGRQSFVNPTKLCTPERNVRHRFKSDKDGGIIDFEIISNNEVIKLFRRKEKEELHLELTRELSPKTFYRNGKKVYSIDTDAGNIAFPNSENSVYDISEPVYPHQLALLLFSMVDWNKTKEESFVYLYNSGMSASVITATRVPEQESGNDSTIIRFKGFRSPITLYISKGIPIKYTTGDNEDMETFTRIQG